MQKRNRKMVFEEQPLPLTGLGSEGGINADTTVIDTQGNIIPFCSGRTGVSLQNPNAAGQSSIAVIGSGAVSTAISLTDNQFTLDSSRNFSFIMPCTATLKSIYANVMLSGALTPGATVSYNPYVAIATAPQGSSSFTIEARSITPVGSYQSSTSYLAGAWQSGSRDNLEITILEGTKVAIIIGTNGSTNSSLSNVFFTGSLFFQ